MGFGQEYAKFGIKGFYEEIGESYTNPHQKDIKNLIKVISVPNLRYLDLGAGDGIVSQELIANNCLNVEGCEPFLNDLYKSRTKLSCLTFSFEDIAKGLLNKQYDVIVCSYAMHLAEKSILPNLLFQLSQSCRKLIILTPHKNPVINIYWTLQEETVLNKTTMRIYVKKDF